MAVCPPALHLCPLSLLPLPSSPPPPPCLSSLVSLPSLSCAEASLATPTASSSWSSPRARCTATQVGGEGGGRKAHEKGYPGGGRRLRGVVVGEEGGAMGPCSGRSQRGHAEAAPAAVPVIPAPLRTLKTDALLLFLKAAGGPLSFLLCLNSWPLLFLWPSLLRFLPLYLPPSLPPSLSLLPPSLPSPHPTPHPFSLLPPRHGQLRAGGRHKEPQAGVRPILQELRGEGVRRVQNHRL